MRIRISGSDGKLNLCVPTGLVLNRLTLGPVLTALNRKYNLPVKREQAGEFARALRQYRREHPEWVLVDVESADGERVYIKV